jgi:predicted metalloprotease
MAMGGGFMIVLLLLGLLFGADPMALLETVSTTAGPPVTEGPAPNTPEENAKADFVSAVLGETEDVWREQFAVLGATYQEPTLVLFSGVVQSACGTAQSAMGPFYCPGDRKVYLDMSFFDELSRRFGAPGDFAAAYVIAHEVGHHVQNLMGTTDKMQALRGRLSEREYNQMSVRLELQADFYAGVWAHHAQKARQILEAGDIEEGLNAASAIGDDRLQRRSQGHVVPDAFTHGTSEQRVRWFRKGLETGDVRQGNTFEAEAL